MCQKNAIKYVVIAFYCIRNFEKQKYVRKSDFLMHYTVLIQYFQSIRDLDLGFGKMHLNPDFGIWI